MKLVKKESLSDLEIARLVTSDIIQALSQCGPYRDPPLGEMGKAVVARMGGWQYLCAEVTHENLRCIQAEMRELLTSLLSASRAGYL